MCVIIFINLKRNIIYITCISVLSRHVATFLKVEGEGGQTYPKNDKKTSKKQKQKQKPKQNKNNNYKNPKKNLSNLENPNGGGEGGVYMNL